MSIWDDVQSCWYYLANNSELQEHIDINEIGRRWEQESEVNINSLSLSNFNIVVIFHRFELCLVCLFEIRVWIKILNVSFIWWVATQLSVILLIQRGKFDLFIQLLISIPVLFGGFITFVVDYRFFCNCIFAVFCMVAS